MLVAEARATGACWFAGRERSRARLIGPWLKNLEDDQARFEVDHVDLSPERQEGIDMSKMQSPSAAPKRRKVVVNRALVKRARRFCATAGEILCAASEFLGRVEDNLLDEG